jgi:undecaprenyldiphospho-muramoylpentapeptide beta-N-acetylglucosaminyltransferase
MRFGLAAAGSGGHVYPALAVADALVSRGVDRADIVFFGGDRMEATTVPGAGYRFVQVDIHGFRRTISTANVTLPIKVRNAAKRIAAEIRSMDLSSMIVFGGYISGPAAQAARRCGVPVVVHEANAVPGMANRMVAGRAELVLLGFERARARLKRGVVVGNPLRSSFDIFDRDRDAASARMYYGVPESGPVVGIVGGSLGAKALNEIATGIALREPRPFHLLHLTGPTHADTVSGIAEGIAGWKVVAYEEDMARFYAACDLVISRAGALTISELEETATPAIVVPLPAGHGYQRENAAGLVDAGGAMLIDQQFPEMIVDQTFFLMANDAVRGTMAKKAGETGHRHAALEVARRVMELVGA